MNRSTPRREITKSRNGALRIRLGERSVRLRRDTRNVPRAVRRREERRSRVGISLGEFARRKTMQDRDGNQYAYPRPGDPVFERQLRTGRLFALTKKTRERPRPSGSKFLLFARKKSSRARINRVVTIRDTETQTMFTGRVKKAFFERRSVTGYVIVEQTSRVKSVVDPGKFLI